MVPATPPSGMDGEFPQSQWGLPSLRNHDGLTLLACFLECLSPLEIDEHHDTTTCWLGSTLAFLSRVCRETDTLYHLHDGMGADVDIEHKLSLLVALRN